jgi:hypothetical protein
VGCELEKRALCIRQKKTFRAKDRTQSGENEQILPAANDGSLCTCKYSNSEIKNSTLTYSRTALTVLECLTGYLSE